MLSRFIMNNFTSFKESTTIDLNATNYKILSETNTYKNTVKGALFVGANASGKTNIIRALRLLLELLFAERVVSLAANQCLFSRETFYSVDYTFLIEGKVIRYLIEYRKTGMIENLQIDDVVILNRIGSEAKTDITENKIYTDIDNNSLLLREVYFNTRFRNHPTLKRWFDFLSNSVYVDAYNGRVFSPGKFPLDISDYLEADGVESINQFFADFNFNQRIEYANSSSGQIVTISNDENKSIFFKREGVGEPIPYEMESLGNQNLLNLLPAFFHVMKHGGMLIIDEFSSGFHNFLEELLIRFFMRKSKNAQIFLVSHSTNLLSNALLRPDQIFAVRFEEWHGSKIKRFSSEQPREAQNIEKMYTSGVFGGVPSYQDDYT